MLTIDIDGMIIRLHKETPNPAPEPTMQEGIAADLRKLLPKIGDYWPLGGGIYAWMMRATEGHARDYQLVLVESADKKGDWQSSMNWAECTGQGLPTLRELSLLRANLPEHFQPEHYWSCEAHESKSDCAWCQYFSNGYQLYYPRGSEFRARAVRRLSI
ncbi:hypothetical protein [Burkholderia gladioli]|uniref:hypothetical protein n=1 Tax=Burkholderia gladioli TaxID=28095 RepID=UPI0034DABDE4